ncbi:unnamed protein product, partial [Trichogramma brassicae]
SSPEGTTPYGPGYLYKMKKYEHILSRSYREFLVVLLLNYFKYCKGNMSIDKSYFTDQKKFGRKSHLLDHQKTVHEGRKDYACVLLVPLHKVLPKNVRFHNWQQTLFH